jgi:O-acetylhomoserine/O-acetylserine sulfhydrylase-like pyridoxal-dependent enzyme
MAITQAMATSFKVEILDGIHNFGTGVIRASTAADVFKLALFTSSATLSATTTAYSSADEVSSSGTNYTAGGLTLTISQVPTSSSTTAFIDFDDLTFPSATITANGALIYNATQGNKSVAVLDFGSDKVVSNDTFQIVFPTANATSAIVRIN